MSSINKYLYYKQDLYQILKEDADNYYLHRHNRRFIEKHNV